MPKPPSVPMRIHPALRSELRNLQRVMIDRHQRFVSLQEVTATLARYLALFAPDYQLPGVAYDD